MLRQGIQHTHIYRTSQAVLSDVRCHDVGLTVTKFINQIIILNTEKQAHYN
jgi:hypothetical protein